MSDNADQIAYWNGPVGEKWARYQAEMDRNLAAPSQGLLAFAAPRGGERVLDIGCGAGETSLRIAEAVGAGGAVTGLDISRPLLERARARGTAPNVAFVEADASVSAFAPEHDLIVSRFGVMFFDDPAAAFANIRKAAAKGGRLAFVCWRVLAENEWARVPLEAVKPLLPEQPPADPHAPGPFAFADPARVRTILERAGFRDVVVEKLDGVMDLGPSLDHAAFQMTNLGPASRGLRDADDATREKAQGAVQQALAGMSRTGANITPKIACWLVGAKA